MFHCYILRLGGGTLGNCTQLIPHASIYILQAIFFLSESDGFKPVSHREIVISARLLVTNLKH